MIAMVLNQCAPMETSPLQRTVVPEPVPGPNEVRVKVKVCGICRTDLHIIEGELPDQGKPVIPGHQIVGIVDLLGAGASRFKIGDRIGIAWLRHTCGECVHCRGEQENLCEHSTFTGYHAPGGYAQYAVVPEEFAYPIPRVFADEEAAPLLCGGIIGYRSLKRSQCRPGQSLALFGFGSSAHIVIQVARYWGCTVYVCTRSEKHRALASELGASWVGVSAADMPVDVDSAIIFAPAGELVPAALSRLRKGGTLALAGIYMTPIPQLDYERHLFYEKNLHSVTANTRQDGAELLEVASKIPIRPQVQMFSLEEANRALLELKRDRLQGSGILRIDADGPP
ncbi:MAG: zinc-dependent alcohol dehydrogenase family protein [Deltaproteobacteria bacterium]|nr:zinc-dependent alcohol dehydrogenase family protein [Deltaproteobacteria bacterium]